MAKRFYNNLPNNKEVNMNSFFSIFIGSMAVIDSNLLKWVEAFHKDQTGKDLDFTQMKIHFMKMFNEQIKINIH